MNGFGILEMRWSGNMKIKKQHLEGAVNYMTEEL